jgi:fused signal recognition particle receptor
MQEDVVEALEEVLFTADIGVKTSELLLERVNDRIKDKRDFNEAMDILRDEILKILKTCEKPFTLAEDGPQVVLVVGVNGTGKTTTIGKLAAKLRAQGKRVLLVAGDTFRAAAIEQLDEWATRARCEIFSAKQGADPSGTIFDGIKTAVEGNYDVILADTAGRLHNKKDLVEELKKIHRVCGKALDGAPQQCLLVLDSTNGQNALIQAREFGEAIDFSGVVLTKLDGTAKGGIIIGICEEFKKPVHFIGIGEMVDDLRDFKAEEFMEALFMDF